MASDIGERGNAAFSLVEQLTASAMNSVAEDDKINLPDVLYVGLNAVAGALRPVAAVLGYNKGDENININSVTMLVAALLTARVANAKPDGDTQMDYGPHQIFKAIDAAQKVLGSDPRASLNKNMVSAADSFKPDARLGNSWNVNNTPSHTDDERPRYLN